LVERKHPRISHQKQCKILGISRSTLNYKPIERNTQDIEIIKIMKQLYLKEPTFGSRRIVAVLKRKLGIIFNRKKIQRLRQEMGMKTIYCRPRTTIANKSHKKYPYLLSNLRIYRTNQVWCTDITYVPMPRGYVYLCCILDWYSRKVLGWEVSNTMDASLCQKAFLSAIEQTKTLPDIFNTDQGSQFTSTEWIEELTKRGISISMDGKGRWRDNVYIERFWRSVKYECIFLHEYGSLPDLKHGLNKWIKRYNTWRPHQALNYQTPDQVYQEGLCLKLEALSLTLQSNDQITLGASRPQTPGLVEKEINSCSIPFSLPQNN
jgi:putative transposase